MRKFTIEDTNFSKGIAVCFLIVHHLFWDVPNIGLSINGIALSQRIGIVGKVCVAIFLILSGYGINESSKKGFNLKQYYLKRFKRIYLDYWLAIILFFIVGLVFFYNDMEPLINSNSFIKRLIENITGFQFLLGYKGFIRAWWFITIIVVFYFIYPVVRKLVLKYNHKFLLASLIVFVLSVFPVNILNAVNIIPWVFPFILGIYLSNNNGFEVIYSYTNSRKKYIYSFISIILLFLLYFRQYIGQDVYGIITDTALGTLIIIVDYLFLIKITVLRKIMVYLGKYSVDIFLIHMAISSVFLKDFTYSLRYPVLMFLFVLGVSLVISIIIKLIKVKAKYIFSCAKVYFDS